MDVVWANEVKRCKRAVAIDQEAQRLATLPQYSQYTEHEIFLALMKGVNHDTDKT